MEFVEVNATRAKQAIFEAIVDKVDFAYQRNVEQRFCYESRHKSGKHGIQNRNYYMIFCQYILEIHESFKKSK